MSEEWTCAYCKESIEGESVIKFGKIYCSEACAFEANGRPRPKQCGTPVAEAPTRDPALQGQP